MTMPADDHNSPPIDLPGRAGAASTALLLEELPAQLYLHYYSGSQRVMAVIEPASYDPGSGVLKARWPEAASSDYGPPASGEPAVASLHSGGMLHLIDALVAGSTGEGRASLQLQLAPIADSFNRRRHPRFVLEADVELAAQDGGSSFTSTGTVPLNISQGGFGLKLPGAAGWEAGSAVEFTLDVQAHHGSAGLPGIRLQGKAAVRRNQPLESGGVQLGCEFTELSEYRASVLRFWLDSFSVYLREG